MSSISSTAELLPLPVPADDEQPDDDKPNDAKPFDDKSNDDQPFATANDAMVPVKRYQD